MFLYATCQSWRSCNDDLLASLLLLARMESIDALLWRTRAQSQRLEAQSVRLQSVAALTSIGKHERDAVVPPCVDTAPCCEQTQEVQIVAACRVARAPSKPSPARMAPTTAGA